MPLPSLLSIYKIAVGPSSSHTLGCINIGRAFRAALASLPPQDGLHLRVELLGSLAHTGRGHLSDLAVVAGLTGYSPEDPSAVSLAERNREIELAGTLTTPTLTVRFRPSEDLVLNVSRTPTRHPNTVVFHVIDCNGNEILNSEYLSVGGGTIVGPEPSAPATDSRAQATRTPESFSRALATCEEKNQDLLTYILEHEALVHGHSEAHVFARLATVWRIMEESVERGLSADGVLPGELHLQRRAQRMFANYIQSLREWKMLAREITLANIYAIAVAEENAGGGRVVTAPTCGSAGIVPAVLHMLQERYHLSDRRVHEGLAIAGFVGSIVVRHASISGAEVGCQGEVGVASAMAAAAACYLIGGTNQQIECAAEVALEHHLGLACDPVGGLVQIPCIERNAVGAVAALNASNLAFLSDGEHRVSFDNTVRAMKEIGHDMSCKYKETALGGLATNWLRRTQI